VTVTRAWRHEGYEGGVEEGLILVDGREIGSTWWCGADYIPAGRRWASDGPAGCLYGDDGFPTREAAEQAQVDAYARAEQEATPC
jgi:hypothetical protein